MSLSTSVSSSFQTDTTIHTAAGDEQVTISGIASAQFVVGHYRSGVLLASAGVELNTSATFAMQNGDELHAVCVGNNTSYVSVTVAV